MSYRIPLHAHPAHPRVKAIRFVPVCPKEIRRIPLGIEISAAVVGEGLTADGILTIVPAVTLVEESLWHRAREVDPTLAKVPSDPRIELFAMRDPADLFHEIYNSPAVLFSYELRSARLSDYRLSTLLRRT